MNLTFARTACAVHENFLNADALHVQIVQSREKILQQSGLYEAPPRGKLKNIMVFYTSPHVLHCLWGSTCVGESSPVSCPQSHARVSAFSSLVRFARTGKQKKRLGVLTIYTDHSGGNLVHKHNDPLRNISKPAKQT